MTFIFTSVSFASINSVERTEKLALKYKPMGRKTGGGTENKLEAQSSFSKTGTDSVA